MQSDPMLVFVMATIVLVAALLRYVGPGIEGVLMGHTRMPSPFSWEWRKKYELRGFSAMIAGCAALVFCGALVYGWIWLVITEFVAK